MTGPVLPAASTATRSAPTTIVVADSADLLIAAYRGRYRVFVGEGILTGDGDDEVLIDHFDALPGSRQFVAVADDGRVVGGIRATLGSDLGLPCDRFVDFRPHLAVPLDRVATGSFLWVDPAWRTSRLGLDLVRAAVSFARSQDICIAVAAVRPAASPILRRLGWAAVGPEFDHPIERCPVVPMMADLAAA